MFSSTTIANYFMVKAWEQDRDITAIHLQPLVYMANGWFLANRSKRLIYDDIEAWHYGPVIPVLFHRASDFGTRPIKELIAEPFGYGPPEFLPKDVQEFLDLCANTFGHWSGGQLLRRVTEAGTPWAAARAKNPEMDYGLPIHYQDIQAYYSALLAEKETQETTEAHGSTQPAGA